ncbi:hypothetical protein [uncultured Flavobacterium sp.]|mgnify:CR=1 FL=1|uniref:hypothetical protein n=1 Tax=uncultured Flavobacterium sp. TaxID=165435 RepID=UPI0025933D18|nr:hypothetical protein [uncultured Flavobacterium sp.]
MENNDLEILIRKGVSLQEEMRKLFKNNNLKNGQLKYLPKNDFEKWIALHNESNILSKKIAEIVSSNAN